MRVLIVDDDVLVAEVLMAQLESLGVQEVRVARTLTAGWAEIEAAAPDLAILDVNLGRDLVFPLAADLAARNIAFVFSSGTALTQTLPQALRERPLLPKPLSLEQLARALRDVGSGFTPPAHPSSRSPPAI